MLDLPCRTITPNEPAHMVDGEMALLADGSESACSISSSDELTLRLECPSGVGVSDRLDFFRGEPRPETPSTEWELGLRLLDGRRDSDAEVCAFRASLTMQSTKRLQTPHASIDLSIVITQCLGTCLASFHAVTASSIAGFTLKVLTAVSFQHVGHVGFALSWLRAHCKEDQ